MGFLTPTLVCSNCQLQFGFPTPTLVPTLVSASESLPWLVSTPSICLSVSPILGAAFALCPPVSVYPQRVVGISVCSDLYLLLQQSDDFQAPYVWNRN